MVEFQWGQRLWSRIFNLLLVVMVIAGLTGCSVSRDRPTPQSLLSEPSETPNRLVGRIAEVSPPQIIQTLGQALERYQPQVKILVPQPGQVIQGTTVSVKFQVKDLPLFKDEDLGLGLHLAVFLDDRLSQEVYDPRETLEFSGLTPGSHTLRVFAVRPWHEGFKNQGAYAETTFHVFTKTPRYRPERDRPLLTYSRPEGSYGAEPIMLDFYLTNAPLHIVAQEDDADEVLDWRVRCTVNGQSFVFDQWQPIYLKGFKPGTNWVQLALIDENGDPIENAFNNEVRLIEYVPDGDDTLSKLMRDEVAIADVGRIIDQNYQPPIEPELPEPELPIEPEVAEPEPEAAEGAKIPTEVLGSEDQLPEIDVSPDDGLAEPAGVADERPGVFDAEPESPEAVETPPLLDAEDGIKAEDNVETEVMPLTEPPPGSELPKLVEPTQSDEVDEERLEGSTPPSESSELPASELPAADNEPLLDQAGSTVKDELTPMDDSPAALDKLEEALPESRPLDDPAEALELQGDVPAIPEIVSPTEQPSISPEDGPEEGLLNRFSNFRNRLQRSLDSPVSEPKIPPQSSVEPDSVEPETVNQPIELDPPEMPETSDEATELSEPSAIPEAVTEEEITTSPTGPEISDEATANPSNSKANDEANDRDRELPTAPLTL